MPNTNHAASEDPAFAALTAETYSDGHVKPPDFYNLIAKHRGYPDGWQWVSVAR